MITDLFIEAACEFAAVVLSYLPSDLWGGAVGLWNGMAGAWNTVEPYFSIAAYWVPVNMVLAGWFGLLALRWHRVLFRAVYFVYRMIPIIGH